MARVLNVPHVASTIEVYVRVGARDYNCPGKSSCAVRKTENYVYMHICMCACICACVCLCTCKANLSKQLKKRTHIADKNRTKWS